MTDILLSLPWENKEQIEACNEINNEQNVKF